MEEEKDTTNKSEEKSDADSESDLVFEEGSEDEDASVDARGAISKLRGRLKKIEAEKQEYLLGWQKSKADYINARKRDEENNREFAKFARSDLVQEIIPVLDSYDMALMNKVEWEKIPEEWRKGMEGIRSQLLSVLSKNGLREVNPLNEQFDPSLEEAVGFIDTDNAKDEGKVLQVLQKGYFLHDKLIRPAKVKIGKIDESESI